MRDGIEKFDWFGFFANGFFSSFGLGLTVDERQTSLFNQCMRFFDGMKKLNRLVQSAKKIDEQDEVDTGKSLQAATKQKMRPT